MKKCISCKNNAIPYTEKDDKLCSTCESKSVKTTITVKPKEKKK